MLAPVAWTQVRQFTVRIFQCLGWRIWSQYEIAPAIDAVEYETRLFAENFVTKGPYMGREEDGLPTDETDKLWNELYACEFTSPLSQPDLLEDLFNFGSYPLYASRRHERVFWNP